MAEKSTTSMTTRIVIIAGAALFLLTSSALAFFVIYDMVTNKDDATTTPLTATTSSTDDSSNQGQVGTQLDGFTPVDSVTELKKTDIQEGDGDTVKPGDTVTVSYTGALAETGVIFESSSSPVSFSLDGVIKGWTEGIPGMKVGGTRQLLIPSDLAYGKAGSPPKIPADAPLVFNVTVLSIGAQDGSGQ